jgi:hypothetical protein
LIIEETVGDAVIFPTGGDDVATDGTDPDGDEVRTVDVMDVSDDPAILGGLVEGPAAAAVGDCEMNS